MLKRAAIANRMKGSAPTRLACVCVMVFGVHGLVLAQAAPESVLAASEPMKAASAPEPKKAASEPVAQKDTQPAYKAATKETPPKVPDKN